MSNFDIKLNQNPHPIYHRSQNPESTSDLFRIKQDIQYNRIKEIKNLDYIKKS